MEPDASLAVWVTYSSQVWYVVQGVELLLICSLNYSLYFNLDIDTSLTKMLTFNEVDDGLWLIYWEISRTLIKETEIPIKWFTKDCLKHARLSCELHFTMTEGNVAVTLKKLPGGNL